MVANFANPKNSRTCLEVSGKAQCYISIDSGESRTLFPQAKRLEMQIREFFDTRKHPPIQYCHKHYNVPNAFSLHSLHVSIDIQLRLWTEGKYLHEVISLFVLVSCSYNKAGYIIYMLFQISQPLGTPNVKKGSVFTSIQNTEYFIYNFLI